MDTGNAFGSDYINIVDESGQEFTLEHIMTIEMNDEMYMAFLPADMDEDDPNFGTVLLKVVENGSDVEFATIDDEKEIELTGSKTGYWIHRSLLWFGIAGDRDGALHVAPSAKSKTVKVTGEGYFHPVAIRGNWVKVISVDGKCSGWLHCDRICDNPLTTCP